MKISLKTVLAGTAAVVILGAGAWLVLRMEGEPPAITFPKEVRALGKTTAWGFVAEDEKSGLRQVRAWVRQGEKSTTLFSEDYPGRGTKRREVSLTLEPRALGLADGAATLIVAAQDHSLKNFKGNSVFREIPITIDTEPPRLDVLSTQYNVNRGGVGVVAYRLSEPAALSGVDGRRSFLPRLPRGGGRGGRLCGLLRDPARRAGGAGLQPERPRRGRQRGAPRLRRAAAREGLPLGRHQCLRRVPRREAPGVPRRRPLAAGRPGGGFPRREPRLARPRPPAHPRGVRRQFAEPPLERRLPADAEHEEHGGLGAGPHLQAQRAGHRPPDAPRPRPRLHRRGPGAGGQRRDGGVLRRSRHLRPGGDPRPRPGALLAVRPPEPPRRQAGRAGGARRGGRRERPDRDGRRRPPALLASS